MNEILDTGDESQVKNSRRQAVIQEKQKDQNLFDVMNTAVGRSVLWDIASIHGAYQSSFSNDPIVMAFNEGERNFSVRLMDRLLRVCPELYLLAQKEAIERGKVNNGRRYE